MGFKLAHFVASFLLFAVLVQLLVGFYGGIQDGYGITKGDQKSINHSNQSVTGNIVDQFNSMNLIAGINLIQTGFQTLGTVKNPEDVVGGFMLNGFKTVGRIATGTGQVLGGIAQTTFGLIVTPFELGRIITAYYGADMPLSILTGLISMIIVYAAFIFLSIKIGRGGDIF